MAESNSSLHCATSVSMADINLDSTEMKSHPNAMPFSGTLLLVDKSSDQPPHGADGHSIYVPKGVAEDNLKSLINMGINYEDDLSGHNPKRKVGVITNASVDGDKVNVKGLIWKKDFPEAVAAFRQNKGQLGMSMELGDVYVRDKDEPVWHLQDFHFTGATILLKDNAAYSKTSLAASKHFVKALAAAKSALGNFSKGGKLMAKEKDSKKDSQSQGAILAAAISAAVDKGFKSAIEPFITASETSSKAVLETLHNISESQEALVKGLHELALANIDAATDGEVPTEDAPDADSVEAGTDPTMAMARQDATDDQTQEDATSQGDDASEVDAEGDPTNYSSSEQGDDATPGDLNKDASSNAKSNARSGSTNLKPGGAAISKGIAAARRSTGVAQISAAAKVIRTINAEKQALVLENSRLRNRIGAVEASLERYADRVERKSVTPEIHALLEKSGYDTRELLASRTKLSVTDVDSMLLNSGANLEPQMRAAFKNQLLQAGLMETGEVRRWS